MPRIIGISPRDYFAAHAISACGYECMPADRLAAKAYEVADLMLELRKQAGPSVPVVQETEDSGE